MKKLHFSKFTSTLTYFIGYFLLPADNFAAREPYDRVIRCLGFKVSLALNLKHHHILNTFGQLLKMEYL